ncbi:M18 family aminopeptidase [Leucobacter sp. G161]|uniref:M18 family aminopeptidase n=1 Tax=Leucobacter sp. G161 TaxID=663704 RepID=UPI00073B880C|nr:M18 family aminopeptidase [Leucobacter sp. G161]KUF06363.1 aminopeptidase [Leucobacter sp. G161]
MTETLLGNRDAYINEFIDYVGSSPSSYHAARFSAAILAGSGFTEHAEEDAWGPVTAGSRGVVVRDGALIAWRAGEAVTATSPVRVLGAHTDSPGFVLKPQPDFTAAGWSQAGVEVYGGPLINSWLDRDLGFAGRVVTRSGEERLVCTQAVARIPQLAIHLDRDANSGLTLDRQRNTQPILAVSSPETSVLDLLAAAANLPQPGEDPFADAPSRAVLAADDGGRITAADIAGTDVRLYDTQSASRIGALHEFLASPRLDNLSSTFAGLVALLETEPAPGTISVFASFDHEELGSDTRSGAAGPFLEDVLTRLRAGLGATADEAARAMAASWCLSADAGHSVHPNYQEKHDPNVRPLAGQGPMLKVNANQRYASDAHGAALWQRACEAAGVPTQEFVSNNTVPCGSTIGPITATRLGIRTVDVGVPLLSMHSARELAHVDDLHGLARAIGAFYAGA